tara:strand:- start:4976 stop:5356 length:381 start_codon:yes stop_codon:yes gene_type:complete
MKSVINLLIVIISLLSLFAGIAKVIHSPDEVQFLQHFMFNDFAIILYGVIQIFAAALLSMGLFFSYNKVAKVGAVFVALAFLLSSVLIFVSGNFMFALISLLPVACTALIIRQMHLNNNINTNTNT